MGLVDESKRELLMERMMRVATRPLVVVVVAALALTTLVIVRSEQAAHAQVTDPPGLARVASTVLEFGDNPFGIELDPETGYLHVTETAPSNTIRVYDGEGRAVSGRNQYGLASVTPPGGGTAIELDYPSDLAFMGDWIYVAYFRSSVVVRYDRSSFDYIDFVELDYQPVGIDAFGGSVYITQRETTENNGAIVVYDEGLDVEQHSHVAEVGSDCSIQPNDVAVTQDWIYVATLGGTCYDEGVYRMDRATGDLSNFSQFQVPLNTYSLATGLDGQLFATSFNGMTVIDTATSTVIDTVNIGAGNSTGITVHPTGTTAWVIRRSLSATSTMFAATSERCAGQEPVHVLLDGTALTLRAARNDGLPPDSGTAGVTCSADGDCFTIGLTGIISANGGPRIPQRECNALEDLYRSTNGPDWLNSGSWQSLDTTTAFVDPCILQGVTCANGHVIFLDLPNRGLAGPLPESLADLTQLGRIRMQSNALTGPLPSRLGELTRLGELSLSDNDVTGPIPASINDLASLQVLLLDQNELAGALPAMDKLTSLRSLNLSENDLTGPLPASFGTFANLLLLDVHENDLTGPIPASLGNLDSLVVLDVQQNKLTGAIPSALGSLASLTSMDLGNNQLTGPIPPSFGGLGALTSLSLDNNQLTGPPPAQLANLSNLTTLSLGSNKLSGPVPTFVVNMPSLLSLGLGSNLLSGPIPRELGTMTDLESLSLADNPLTGVIPNELTSMTSLQTLFLSRSTCLLAEDVATQQFYESRPINDALANGFRCALEDDIVTFVPPEPILIDVLANDGLPLSAITSFEVVEQPSNATATIEAGQIRYTPKATGNDHSGFVYEVCTTIGCERADVSVEIEVPVCFTARGNTVKATAWGTNGNDVITNGPDFEPVQLAQGETLFAVVSFGGDDIIDSGDAFGYICSGDGNDTITTGNTNDVVFGGNGDDTISTGLGVDVIFAQGGDDVVNGEGGSDHIWGGPGEDTIRGGSGADRIRGGADDDILLGMGGQDQMWGESGNDQLQGNWQSDRLYGGPGDDIIRGAGGKDRLYGESGNDELYGGLNSDFLDGGTGTDLGDGQKGKDNPLILNIKGCINVETRVSC